MSTRKYALRYEKFQKKRSQFNIKIELSINLSKVVKENVNLNEDQNIINNIDSSCLCKKKIFKIKIDNHVTKKIKYISYIYEKEIFVKLKYKNLVNNFTSFFG